MLKRATTEDLSQIEALCKEGIIGTKILCYIKAYGFDRAFLEVWIMTQDEEITSVFIKFYDDITLLALDNADTSQLSSFLGMFYYKTLMCTKKVCELLGLEAYTEKNGYIFCSDASGYTSDSIQEEDFKAAYNLVSKEIPDSFKNTKEAYLSFLSDFTFRQRRELARGVCVHEENKLLSVALTSSETESCAIVSAVACDASVRKKGLGKRTVLSIVGKLQKENKKVYIIALNQSAEGFYEHIGFRKSEKIAFVERK